MILFDDAEAVASAPSTGFTPEHSAARSKVIGASEVAALFGLSPYTTLYELWHRKAGDLPEVDLSDNERVFWGQILERAIAEGIALQTGWRVGPYSGHVLHPTVAGMGCSPDCRVQHPERGDGLLQIKNVDALIFAKWPRSESGAVEPPMNYQLQVQHELACTGKPWGALAVLVGGNRLEIFEFERHEGVIARIEAEVTRFWQSIEAGEEPQPDFARDLETIRMLYGDTLEGEVVDLSGNPRVSELCADYTAASGAEKSAKARKDAAKAELLTLIGPAEMAFSGDWKISAKQVAGGPVSYVRETYRGFRVSESHAERTSKNKTN